MLLMFRMHPLDDPLVLLLAHSLDSESLHRLSLKSIGMLYYNHLCSGFVFMKPYGLLLKVEELPARFYNWFSG